ncbi:MAG: hypothetical protein PWQ10_525 [Patescibacteria group bacterium]|nr:hypothetical protein [Patescibacteria group bacterium]
MFEYSFIGIAWVFLIYAIIGWCLEVITATINTGKFVNRGFLNGPYCPIYGVGVIGVLILLTPIKDSLPLLFVSSLIITTALELITGYLLKKIFNQKWWDYSKENFNFFGYICLKSSILWGLACVLVFYVVQPIINNFIYSARNDIGNIIVILLLFVLAIDVVITVISLMKVKKKNLMLQDIGDRIRSLSGAIGQNISDGTVHAMNFSGNNMKELENLKKKYQTVINKKTLGYNRIFKAFPVLGSIKPKLPEDKNK